MFYIKDFVATMDQMYVHFKLNYKHLFKHTKYLKEDQALTSSYRWQDNLSRLKPAKLSLLFIESHIMIPYFQVKR